MSDEWVQLIVAHDWVDRRNGEKFVTQFVANLTVTGGGGGGGDVPSSRLISAGTGLTGGGDLSADRTIAADFGTGAGKVTEGNDSRLSDARTPTAHVHAGSDVTSGTIATARLGTGTADNTTFLRGDQTWAVPAGGGGAPVSTWSPPSGAWVPLAASYNGSSGGGGGSGANAAQSNGLAILQWCQLPAAVAINGLRVFLNAANGGASARAGLSLWNPDGPNGGPGTGIAAPSANVAINGSPGEKEVTWATAVTLPVSGFWFAWTPYGLDVGGANPNFWAYPRGNDHLWASGAAPSGNSRRPQMIVTGLSGYTPTTNPTVSSQYVLGSTVDATAVMVRIA